MKKIIIILAVLLSPMMSSSAEKYRVLRVIDGDTVKIEYGASGESVRLIGIDAPESSSNSKAARDSKRHNRSVDSIVGSGKRSSAFVRSVLKKGDYVTLEFDVQQRDRYGRLLAYVYLADGRMLNELVVSSGYAYLLTVPPNVRYRDRLRDAYTKARNSGAGLWGD